MILSRCTAILWKYVSVCLCLSAWRSLLSGTIRTVCLTRSMCASQPAGLHEKQKGVNLSERKSERRLHPRLLVFHFLSCHVFNQHYSSLHFSFFFFCVSSPFSCGVACVAAVSPLRRLVLFSATSGQVVLTRYAHYFYSCVCTFLSYFFVFLCTSLCFPPFSALTHSQPYAQVSFFCPFPPLIFVVLFSRAGFFSIGWC